MGRKYREMSKEVYGIFLWDEQIFLMVKNLNFCDKNFITKFIKNTY
jgi:hypothetical protein